MADRYYSTTIAGNTANDVTESTTATPAAFVDVRVTYDASQSSRFTAYKAVEAVAQRILQGTWPPV